MMKFLVFIVLSMAIKSANCICEEGWTAFTDEKCFKILDHLATAENAVTICSQEQISSDSDVPKLLQVSSSDEQKFVTSLIFQEHQIHDSVWLGAVRFNESAFQWPDGSALEYSNWLANSTTNNFVNNCSQISSGLFNDAKILPGAWNPVPCTKRNLVVCQCQSTTSLSELQQMVFALRKQTEELVKVNLENQENIKQLQIEDTANKQSIQKLQETDKEMKELIVILQANVTQNLADRVPIGYIYTEYSSKQSPKNLWPGLGWRDVTAEYSGQFFRAEGGSSAAFGVLQSDSAPRISNIATVIRNGGNSNSNSNSISPGSTVSFPVGGTIASGNNNEETITFTTSGGEVRPRNKAVRIWQRSS